MIQKGTAAPAISSLVIFCFVLFSPFALAEDNGYLKVKSNIEGVELKIDGKVAKTIGTQWDFVELSAGHHSISASKQYYPTQQNNITIQSGRVTDLVFVFEKADDFVIKREKKAKVEKQYGSLSILPDIPGATVKLNGQTISGEIAPLTIDHLAEGVYTVELARGSKSITGKIKIEPNQLNKIFFFFDSKKRLEFVDKLRKLENEKLVLEQKIRDDEKKLGKGYEFITKSLAESRAAYNKVKDLSTDVKKETFYGSGESSRTMNVEYIDYGVEGFSFPRKNATLKFDVNFGYRSSLISKMPHRCVRNFRGFPDALKINYDGKIGKGSEDNKIEVSIWNSSLRKCKNELKDKISNLEKLKANMGKSNSKSMVELNEKIEAVKKQLKIYQNYF